MLIEMAAASLMECPRHPISLPLRVLGKGDVAIIAVDTVVRGAIRRSGGHATDISIGSVEIYRQIGSTAIVE